jgi:hypothetical protein
MTTRMTTRMKRMTRRTRRTRRTALAELEVGQVVMANLVASATLVNQHAEHLLR